jgi:polyhydroxybutyrate depolymerase
MSISSAMSQSALLTFSVLLAACGVRSVAQVESGSGTIPHDGRDRSYVIRVPGGEIASGVRVPLVLVLHGGGGNAANAENMTGFTELARAERFIVVYPEGSARRGRLLTWNAGHCCGYAMQERIDDVGFLSALIDQLVRQYPVDLARIFVTGMSNGAMMSHRAGLELGAKVAAIAPVVGAVFGDESRAGQPVSAVVINGMLDRSVPYDGGAAGGRFSDAWGGVDARPAREQAALWAQRNGCTSPSVTDGPAYIHIKYSCRVGLGVEFYGVKDNGHAWPGGERGSRLGDEPSQSLDATRVIWNFFSNHPKR